MSKYSHSYNWIKFTKSINRQEVPHFLNRKDCFIHAFQGSLDKTLIESTLCMLPVVTINSEYIKIFGSWSEKKSITLSQEIEHLFNLSDEAINKELQRRFDIAYSNHSLDQWVSKLLKILGKA